MIKSLKYLLSLFVIIGLFSCTEKELDPVLSILNAPAITAPTSGASVVLTEDAETDPFNFSWTAAQFSLDNIAKTTYVLQMDAAGNNFANAQTLSTSQTLSFQTTVKAFNEKLLGIGLETDLESNVDLRVVADVDGALGGVNSDVVTIGVTPYSAEILVDPIYALGSATPNGWDNPGGQEMIWVEDGIFEVVTWLKPGDELNNEIKFVAVDGQWAPMWGTDDD